MKRNLPVILLLTCVILVSFWQIMAWRARRGFDAFRITAAMLKDFDPHIEGYTLMQALVQPDPLQPNIISYRATPATGRAGLNRTILVRLAHGYNMVDCMRIKHFQVEAVGGDGGPLGDGALPGSGLHREVWRLTSAINDQSIWMTSMHNGSDFKPLEMSTTSMAFPKIGTPDDPGWQSKGLSRESFRRPIHNLKRTLRHSWNNARCDLLTFLRLRRPVYASDEILALVSTVAIPPANDANPARIEAELIRRQQDVHAGMVDALIQYRGD
ncbi:MAG: hypothetical protein HN919_15450 [Verrucomicrobia bacterium]|nr:hypothetical protein [Verrucomicrobiota bacterium]MBT7067693.1 hypothetical protein [Verrucomicrobiota bacterium]MBT7701546.1 hypothetical protein [Verrucomicrobiota bacterium]